MKDPRYSTIQGLLKEGALNKFTDIFNWIPYTVVATDYSTNHNRMKKMIADPSLWTLEEIYKLADLIGFNRLKLALMAADQVEKMKGIKSPSRSQGGDTHKGL
jgi:hypothetical protein